ncbi:VCBS repeat-containing protein [Akkermansiaceae bacterium]|nr:VCBS repeat-containing protein [Akkermansiaceae bacterium]
MSLNPLVDGWDTEYFNQIAGEQLHRLGDVFEDHGFDMTSDLPGIFTDDIIPHPLRPGHLNEVLNQNGTKVFRPQALPDASNPPSPMSLSECFADLTQTLPKSGERYAKFKIVGIDPTPEGFESKQLVSLNVREAEFAWEQNATWIINWKITDDQDSPLIATITLEDFEEVHSTQGGAWFSDHTSSVFTGEMDIASEQFGVGVGEWNDRLNDYLLVMYYGHNGLAVGDVNGDGFDDLYRCQVGGLPNRLLLGQADGTLKDASKAAGLDFLDNCGGALFVDLDNDGDQDLALAMPLQIVLFKNDGTGKFESAARLDHQNAYSLSAADIDHDGDLDLYACVYYADPKVRAELPIPMPIYDATNGGQNALLRNEGNWEFTNATEDVGLNEDNSRFSFAAIWEDYNNDGHIDLYVVNDFGHNNLYQNKGGEFQHVTAESGTRNGTFGMSAASGDFNRDGWMDFYKASMFSSAGNRVVRQSRFLPTADSSLKQTMLQMAQGNTLFTNDGEGAFKDDGVAAGVSMGRWSWGSIFIDFNNDGWEDLFVTNGFVTGRKPDDL